MTEFLFATSTLVPPIPHDFFQTRSQVTRYVTSISISDNNNFGRIKIKCSLVLQTDFAQLYILSQCWTLLCRECKSNMSYEIMLLLT